ncbi:MAG: tripartite tricarboxylate transporter substrate binding protein [Betaproteobacteria bacterium]|nr:tripartite tricarboxylate transporter substrate binding protein [Betaproteobacteria bacterium]
MKRSIECMVIALAAPISSAAMAQNMAQPYPARALRLVVPAPPGGGTDILGRLIAHKLTEAWRQQVIIDNRAGASGMIGSEIVARAGADGHTLLLSFTTHVTNPSLFAKMPYDTLRDFASVAMVGVIPNVLVVHPSVPSQSVKEFIEYAKARPGKLIYGSAGSGSATHLAAVLFTVMSATSMVHVPYKGATPALTDLLAGQSQLMFGNMASTMPHVRAGKLRALAVTSAGRSAGAPELPTMAQAALPGYEATSWFALFAPARTPGAVIDKLNTEVNAILKLADVTDRMRSIGADAMPMSPRELSAYVESEIAKWGKLIKASGAKTE